jgi:UDP-2,3-diacylglucosamine pyrophosphatase LpxH
MKTVFIGDIHGRSIWKEIVEQEKPDRVIFVGDYFDSFDIPGIDQIHNFKEIIHFKKTSGVEVVLLVGNHDYHYMNMGETYSGFQPALKFDIGQLLKENMEHLQMAYSFDNFLCTHAGVSHVWMDLTFGQYGWDCDNLVEKLNETFKYRPMRFIFNGWEPCGDNKTQSPIWIRIRSLLASNKNRRNTSIKKNFVQIVGHTEIKSIDMVAMKKTLGGKYYMIDALAERQYLVYDEKLSVGSINPKN